jgi:hypothetical protein
MRKNIILVGEPTAIGRKIMVLLALRKDWVVGGVKILALGRDGFCRLVFVREFGGVHCQVCFESQ